MFIGLTHDGPQSTTTTTKVHYNCLGSSACPPPHSRSHSSHSKLHPWERSPKTMPIVSLTLGSRICHVIPLLPSWGSPRSCFALFIKPGFNSSFWLAFYIGSSEFPITRDSQLINNGSSCFSKHTLFFLCTLSIALAFPWLKMLSEFLLPRNTLSEYIPMS